MSLGGEVELDSDTLTVLLDVSLVDYIPCGFNCVLGKYCPFNSVGWSLVDMPKGVVR